MYSCRIDEISLVTRVLKDFSKEIKEFGRISGLSLTSSTSNSLNAMLFHEDCVLVLSKNKEIYKPTVFQMIIIVLCPLTALQVQLIEEEFKMTSKFWNHVQKRFQRRSRRSSVAQSTLRLFQYSKSWSIDFQLCDDSKRLSGNNAIVNKLKTVPMNHLILRENLFVDQGSKHI